MNRRAGFSIDNIFSFLAPNIDFGRGKEKWLPAGEHLEAVLALRYLMAEAKSLV
jgi:hypothetical protein